MSTKLIRFVFLIIVKKEGGSGDRSYFLASAVYAYASIFPKNVKDTLDPFDPRLLTAVDLYNQGLAEGFTKKETGKVVLESGT